MRFARGTWTARHWVAMVVLVLVSAFLQFTNIRETEHRNIIIADGAKYVGYAYNLRQHHTFSHLRSYGSDEGREIVPDKLTLPGYPAFLATLLGDGIPTHAFLWRMKYAQATLGVATTLLAFLIALRMLPLGWAFAVGALTATQPHLIVMSLYPLTEPLTTTLVLAFVLATLHAAAPGGKRWQAALAGVLLGAICMIRPQLQGVPWLVLLAVIFVPRWRPYLKQVALAAAMFAAVVLPWQVRNAQVEPPKGQPDLMAMTLYHGSFPNFMYEDDPRTLGNPYFYDPGKTEHTQDMRSTLSYVGSLFAERPVRYLKWYLIGKPGAFLSWNFVDGVGDIFLYPVTRSPFVERPAFIAARTVHYWLHWPLMGIALLTAFLLAWRPTWVVRDGAETTGPRLLAALMLYVVVVHLLGFPLARYNLPYQPIEFCLALLGVRAVALRLRGR